MYSSLYTKRHHVTILLSPKNKKSSFLILSYNNSNITFYMLEVNNVEIHTGKNGKVSPISIMHIA